MSVEIVRISSDNEVFSKVDFLNDKLVFNYIDNARHISSTEFYSDGERVIICRKEKHKSVWIWTDDNAYNDTELVIEIAKTIREFNISGLEFFTKPNLAQIFSDMYALISNDLNYQVKSEFSLGAYHFTGSKLPDNDTVTVLKYNKKFSDSLLEFYTGLKDEFRWSQDKVNAMFKKFTALNTYLLLKNSQIISVCVISKDSENCSSIRSVATKQDERNNGYATIVTNIASSMHSKNNNSVMLYANDGNESAVATFKKAGYSLIGKVHLIKS